MRHRGEAVATGDVIGPSLDLRLLDLDSTSASAAHEVMVMGLRATAVHGLTVVAAQHVDRALVS
jgi:hypothetical protein